MSSKKPLANTYEMWVAYDSNKKRLRIPVLPEKVEVSYPDDNDEVYIYGVGDVTIKKHPGAFELKFSSFFPKEKCQGSISSPKDPKGCVDFLKKVMELEGPAKFIYTGGAYPLSTHCTIKFSYYEQGGDPGTIYYTLTVKEYKTVSVRKITLKKKSKKAKVSSKSKRTSTKSKPTKYKVKKGDCLWNIAKKYYGSGSKYKKIYNANKKIIGSNPNLIKPGQVLTIPNA